MIFLEKFALVPVEWHIYKKVKKKLMLRLSNMCILSYIIDYINFDSNLSMYYIKKMRNCVRTFEKFCRSCQGKQQIQGKNKLDLHFSSLWIWILYNKF